ncbi:HyaD/HybD family hydrogenase maturation endopeptidase [Desulfuromonas carbonis]|uniref:HyaD/HybD family hydrogenase maturation endopeptidase n=1 Tax=Desulfuromonas sp. DDH964 TaxID=1823759 RepID=UPI00078D57C8|nr:HyaD/HybD family hydrogenase maturation endopeptidase [Desulfuromonas sp. DDH964]AMV73871.1 periplasmically oriented, membrane-bound [NiFe]-hydrogenase maturation protease [Desulfuromonas sp. DDH964]
MSLLILGLGNAVMSDDAFGGRVIAALQQRYRFSERVTILDGGTLGLDLLPHFEGVDRLLIIDALEMGAAPGSIFRLVGEEVPRAFASKLSVHQMGVQDLLAVCELQGHLPAELVVWGVQPGSIEMAMELTPAVAAAVEGVVSAVVGELQRWGELPQAAA